MRSKSRELFGHAVIILHDFFVLFLEWPGWYQVRMLLRGTETFVSNEIDYLDRYIFFGNYNVYFISLMEILEILGAY